MLYCRYVASCSSFSSHWIHSFAVSPAGYWNLWLGLQNSPVPEKCAHRIPCSAAARVCMQQHVRCCAAARACRWSRSSCLLCVSHATRGSAAVGWRAAGRLLRARDMPMALAQGRKQQWGTARRRKPMKVVQRRFLPLCLRLERSCSSWAIQSTASNPGSFEKDYRGANMRSWH